MKPEPASAGDTRRVPPLRGSSFQRNTHPAFRFAPRWAILTPRLRRSAVEGGAVKAHGRFRTRRRICAAPPGLIISEECAPSVPLRYTLGYPDSAPTALGCGMSRGKGTRQIQDAPENLCRP